MPNINLVIRVTNDELEYLRWGRMDKPHPDKLKQLLMSTARSNVRAVESRINEARLHAGKSERVLKAKIKANDKRIAMLQPKANGIVKWEDK